MPEAVDVGSVLGDRYKVTAYVLASAEKDLVLDGVDQVLNRQVSILVASAGNASQVATSARELATGDRNDSVQVLDLGITDAGTYLVTNRASAADLLDLIVQQDAPAPDRPHVEPFFTDTLGSEIFGGPRSTEPETYDDEDEGYEDRPHPRKSRFTGLTGRFGRRDTADHAPDDTSALPSVTSARAPTPQASNYRVPPVPSQRPAGRSEGSTSSTASALSGSASGDQDDDLRDDDGYGTYDGGHRRHDGRDRRRAAGAGAAVGSVPSGARQPEREASFFPESDDRYDGEDYDASDEADLQDGYYEDDDEDETPGGRPFTRVLVGVVLAVVLVIAVVVAATTLSSLPGGEQVADDGGLAQVTTEPDVAEPTTAPPTPTAAPTPDAVAPVITGVTRLVPDNPGLDAGNDSTLPLIVDGNPATFWGNQVYSNDTFGGLATSLALVVDLEAVSGISEVGITQLNGSGGSFTVSVNDQPSLEGAEQVAQGAFTGPTVTLPVPEGAEGPLTAEYVIVNFTQLPRLNIQAQYPFGVRIAEISVS